MKYGCKYWRRNIMKSSEENEVQALYYRIIQGWNNRNAEEMAEQFTRDGELIGFDGSQEIGRDYILVHLQPIFANHPTAPFKSIVKDIRMLSSETALLRATVGMIPNGKVEVKPELNAHQTLVAVKKNGVWLTELFQNTPAQFHGRPELVKQMTEELNASLIS
jgi:uncharacterized protein (TIGR02246 family)